MIQGKRKCFMNNERTNVINLKAGARFYRRNRVIRSAREGRQHEAVDRGRRLQLWWFSVVPPNASLAACARVSVSGGYVDLCARSVLFEVNIWMSSEPPRLNAVRCCTTCIQLQYRDCIMMMMIDQATKDLPQFQPSQYTHKR
jgi:hypothetical protein